MNTQRFVFLFAVIVAVAAAVSISYARPPQALTTIYVTGQDTYYHTFATTDLPPHGKIQQLIPTPGDPLHDGVTEFGPGDKGYAGGRWWVDVNNNGYQDEEDTYFSCPLLGPGFKIE